jgi:hypothetical protein
MFPAWIAHHVDVARKVEGAIPSGPSDWNPLRAIVWLAGEVERLRKDEAHMNTAARERAERIVSDLYGIRIGCGVEAVLDEMGIAALSDDAVIALAELQLDMDRNGAVSTPEGR